MKLNPDICYRALLTHDARFDGRFFVGVSSTGIYCRPVCSAKTPKRESCMFYSTAAAAESAGFRPCLRCRPELALGNSAIDAHERLARDAAGLIEDGVLNESDIEGLAGQLGVTGRHLRRIFQTEFGVSLVQFGQTHRLLLAKRLLTDTDLPVIEVAMASGFSSLRRFNALFKERYGLSPSGLRRSGGHREGAGHFTFHLGYHAPMDWKSLIGFLRKRVIEGVESVAETAYRRSVLMRHQDRKYTGWIEVFPTVTSEMLEVRVSSTLVRVIPQVLAGVKRLFDLRCRPAEIESFLGPLADGRPGLRVPGAFNGLEMAVRAILGQQITVKAAKTVAGRFAAAFGESLASPFPEVRLLFPEARRIAGANVSEIASLGIVSQRARSILSLSRAVADGAVHLAPGGNVEETVAALMALPGIGGWTAQYIAMRALSWPDAFPHTDYGVMKALGEKNPAKVLQAAEKWRPWRAYAVMHLWQSIRRRIMISHTTMQSPLGPILLVSDGSALIGLYFHGQKHEPVLGPEFKPDSHLSIFQEAACQLAEYFSGSRRSFGILLRPRGTPFQEKVWQAIATIPFGMTASYRDLAERIGMPKAARAVGAAVGRNPISVIIPCHRVIGKDGSLTGYAGGLDRKKTLLHLEGGHIIKESEAGKRRR